jgi:hypothetical protein
MGDKRGAGMSVKGSWQRKMNISRDEWDDNYYDIYVKPKERLKDKVKERKSFKYNPINKGRDNGFVLSKED